MYLFILLKDQIKIGHDLIDKTAIKPVDFDQINFIKYANSLNFTCLYAGYPERGMTELLGGAV